MNADSIALYLHILGAAGLLVALGLEWTGLRRVRAATTTQQFRSWMARLESAPKVGFVSMLTAVVTGIYMMLTAGIAVAWVYSSLGAIVLLIVLSAAITRPRMTAIRQALGSERESKSPALHGLASDPLLWISIQTRVAIALGIVFLKIAKPDLPGSLVTIGVAIVLGLASALLLSRPAAGQAGLAE